LTITDNSFCNFPASAISESKASGSRDARIGLSYLSKETKKETRERKEEEQTKEDIERNDDRSKGGRTKERNRKNKRKKQKQQRGEDLTFCGILEQIPEHSDYRSSPYYRILLIHFALEFQIRGFVSLLVTSQEISLNRIQHSLVYELHHKSKDRIFHSNFHLFLESETTRHRKKKREAIRIPRKKEERWQLSTSSNS
jgi:hypothetical protein